MARYEDDEDMNPLKAGCRTLLLLGGGGGGGGPWRGNQYDHHTVLIDRWSRASGLMRRVYIGVVLLCLDINLVVFYVWCFYVCV